MLFAVIPLSVNQEAALIVLWASHAKQACMERPHARSLNCVSRITTSIGLVACSLSFRSSVQAIEDPPGCSVPSGGKGETSQSGINFALAQAHVGDSVRVIPLFGMVSGACRAVNVTGSVYIATGRLTNFLNNATLDPGLIVTYPCDILLTPALVGAGVSSPHGSVPGVPKTVRVMENVDGTVLSGSFPQTLSGGFHTASISIVTPAFQVIQHPTYPQGQKCFQAGSYVEYTGYVTNSGDITLTNVTIIDSRAGQIQLLHPADGQAFPTNVVLPPGASAVFSNGFMPTAEESIAGSATNLITATARDTTIIGGSNSFVTNSTTTASAICVNSGLAATLSGNAFSGNQQFHCNVTGQAGMNYVVQTTTNLHLTNWVSLITNAAPFTFMDCNAALFPRRFYRAMALP